MNEREEKRKKERGRTKRHEQEEKLVNGVGERGRGRRGVNLI